MAKVGDLPRLRLAPRKIRDRVAGEAEIVRWVARNIDLAEPDPKSCPDPFAWTLLRQCREVDGFVNDTFLPLWTKLIPPRSQIENAAPKEQDGSTVIALMDRILAASRAAKGLPPVAKEPESEPKEKKTA